MSRAPLITVEVPGAMIDELDEAVAERLLCDQILEAARAMLQDAYRRLDAARFAVEHAEREVREYVSAHQ